MHVWHDAKLAKEGEGESESIAVALTVVTISMINELTRFLEGEKCNHMSFLVLLLLLLLRQRLLAL